MLAGDWNAARVTIGDVSYPYYFGSHCIDRIVDALSEFHADRFLVVTDDTVLALHGETLIPRLRTLVDTIVLRVEAGEAMKSLSQLSACMERAIAAGATRRSVVIAFGGGVPGNLAGMLAALLFRGIRLVHVPTTTMAAMDSVLSLKQAVNSSYGKNHIGTYYAPAAVYVDVELLQSLPDRQLRSGLCEAAKNCLAIRPQSLPALRGVLASGDLASPAALLWLLGDSLAAKSTVTAADAREQRAGLILEYGHTIGHAVELCDQRVHGAAGLAHGEAVAIGMLAAARIAAMLGVLGPQAVAVHEEIVAGLRITARLPEGVSISAVMEAVRADNKRGYLAHGARETAMVLLRDLGVPAVSGDLPLVLVPLRLIEQVVTDLLPDAMREQHEPGDDDELASAVSSVSRLACVAPERAS